MAIVSRRNHLNLSFRTIPSLQGLVIALGVIQSIVAPLTAGIGGFSEVVGPFGGVAGVFAVVTWVWSSILLWYLNRPMKTFFLSRKKPHLVTFLTLGVIWIALASMLSSQLPSQCRFGIDSDGEAEMWCIVDSISAGIGFILAFLCFIAVAIELQSVAQ
ncbi:hypothetical protein BJ165DRAFT_129808 [Panaeolus papilionaceus]|nr:hypothetical protein BJ165DRAFT_129808 [Panaeolus papilionaceus]